MKTLRILLLLALCSKCYGQGGNFNVVVQNGSGVRVSGMGYWLTMGGNGSPPVLSFNTGNTGSAGPGATVTNSFSLGGGVYYRGGDQVLFVIWSSGSSTSPDLWSGYLTLEPDTVDILLTGSPSLSASLGINGGSNNVCQSVYNTSGSGGYYSLISSATGKAVGLDACGDNWVYVPSGGSAQLCGVVAGGDSVTLTSLASSTQVQDVTSGVLMSSGGDTGCLPGGINLTNYGYNVLGPPVSATNGIAAVPQASGTNGITYPGTTNGPAGGLALNSDMDTGFAALHSDLAGISGVLNVQGAVLGNDILSLKSNLGSGGGGSNGTVVTVSNNFPSNYPDAAAISNLALLSGFLSLTNAVGVSNGMSGRVPGMIGSLTNLGNGSGSALAGAWSNALGGAWSSVPDLGGGPDGWVVPLPALVDGSSFNLTIGMAQLPAGVSSVVSVCQNVMGGLIILVFFLGVVGVTKTELMGVLGQRQIQGSTEEVFGVNVSLLAGAGYASVLMAVALTIPVILGAWLVGNGWVADIVSGWADMAGMSANPAWGMVTAAFPVSLFLSTAIGYWVYRYMLLTPACLLARVVIIFLVA